MSLFFVGGLFDVITLHRVSAVDVINSPLIDTRQGSVNLVEIDDCPGLRLHLQGMPGSIRKINVYRSPGLTIEEVAYNGVKPGAPIEYFEFCPTCGQRVYPSI